MMKRHPPVHSSDNDKPSLRVRYLRQIGRDEEGGVTGLTILLLVVMLVMGGMAADFMRFESRRVVLQNVSDRAVLAAAELDQRVDSKEVVLGYFRSENLEDAIVGEPVVNDKPGDRSVRVESQLDLNTLYLRLIGIDELSAPALSAAIEGTGNIEISMVLDITGSMGTTVTQETGTTGTRMSLLRTAATNFVTELLIPEYRDEISISLVTYSANVSAGEGIYRALNTTPDTILADDTLIDTSDVPALEEADPSYDIEALDPDTNQSRCIEFAPADFATTTFDTQRQYQQSARLDHSNTANQFTKPRCPEEDFQGIVPLTQDPGLLTATIAQLEPTLTTSIHLGMKWGVSLVDPSMRNLLAGVEGVDPAFAGTRPAEYTDNNAAIDTKNYVILMTDGQNVRGRRIKDEYYDDPYWRRAFTNHPYYHWSWYVNDHPQGESPSLNDVTEYPNSAAQQDTWLQQTCNAARDAGIVVFTISMGAPEAGARQMRQCAYTESYFFDAEDEAIEDVFSSIAKQITDLRLNL